MAKEMWKPGEVPENVVAMLSHMPFATHAVINDENFKEQLRDEVFRNGYSFHFRKGCRFEPDSCNFYYLESGRMRMEYIAPSGKIRPLLSYCAGSMLNVAMAMVNDRVMGSFYVLEESMLWRLPREIIAGAGPFCPHIIKSCMFMLSSAMLTYYTGLTFLDVDSFRIRFCRFLILKVKKFGSRVFSLNLTQEDCAALFGVHRATLARTARELKDLGILGHFGHNKVEILNMDRLLEIAMA